MHVRMKSLGTTMLVAATALSATNASALEIGTVAAANPTIQGTTGNDPARILVLGTEVIQNERIQASADGSGQLLFLDQTTLTIAPNADVILDEYVYDPDAGTGTVALTLTRGALRFIGGRITKSNEATIETPTSTIGIRGGLSLVSVNEAGTTRVIHLAGEYTRVQSRNGGEVLLSRPAASASVSEGGGAEFTGIASPEEIGEAYSELEGAGDGGSSDAAQADSSTTGERQEQLASENSGAPGAADREPVSTSGEAPIGEEPFLFTQIASEPAVVNFNPLDPTIVDLDDVIDVDTVEEIPTGGGFFSLRDGFFGFVSVEEGSLIGRGPNGEVLRIEVPTSAADFDQTLFGNAAPDTFSASLGNDSGFFEISGAGNSAPNGSTSLEGVGFSDLDTGFLFGIAETENPNDLSFFLFGTPTPGQGAVSSGAQNLSNDANVVETYQVEADLFEILFGENPLGNDGPETGVALITNGGEAFFESDSTSLPGGGGKALAAEVTIEENGSIQESDIFVLAAPLTNANGTSGGPAISADILGTERFGPSIIIEESRISTFEDGDGNTMFGPNGEFIAVSSVDFGGSGQPQFGVSNDRVLGGQDFQADFTAAVLTRDPSGSSRINDPLPLAGQTEFRANRSGADSIGVIDDVMATGFGACSTFNCGDDFFGNRTGVYALISDPDTNGNSGNFIFQNPSNTNNDTNGVGARFELEVLADTGIDEGTGPGATFSFTTGANDPNSAFIDDKHFGIASKNAAVIADFQDLGDDGNLIVASSPLAGFGNLPDPDVFTNFRPGDEDPEFLRWGWWSATYTPEENGALREDAVHLGHWIGGQIPNDTDIPTSGSAVYRGLAVATVADFNTADIRVVSGDFRLDFEFTDGSGELDLRIAGVTFTDAPVLQDSTRLTDYTFSDIVGNNDLNGRGRFFSGRQDPVAATGAQFRINNASGRRQVVGVFGSDRKR